MRQRQFRQMGGERIVQGQHTGPGQIGQQQHGEGLGQRPQFVAQGMPGCGRCHGRTSGHHGPPAAPGHGQHDVRGVDQGDRVRETVGEPGPGVVGAHPTADRARDVAIAEANAATRVGWWTRSKTRAASPCGIRRWMGIAPVADCAAA